ncbi:hypothetical protein [uncultured Bacteroides sp.]|uniref:hypothetical protein n=1 Tax=uncultured Bacteroides sp. TaxID=162156 RepID=UPI00262AF22B|nr:hypothetical protein [uncultured Bacteroides sp.]
MAEIKYQYAYDETGKLVSINDYTKEDSRLHSYKCIGCGCELLPRAIGSKSRKAHFYHKTLIDCSGETYIHKLGKLLIKRKFDTSVSFLVSYPVSKECNKTSCTLRNSRCEINHEPEIIDLKKYYDTCSEEASVGGFVADLLLTNSQKPDMPPVLIEICVTHPCEDEKRNSGLRIIELTLKTEQDVVEIVDKNIIEEPLFCLNKKKSVEFISFKRHQILPMQVEVSRYIFRPFFMENGNLTKISCKNAGYKLFKDSLVELNIANTIEPNDANILIPLLWMLKNKKLRRCLICKFYNATMYENNPSCKLSKKYGKPKYPAMVDAEQCRYFDIRNNSFNDWNFQNYNIKEVTMMPSEIKEEYRVIIAGSSSFCDYDMFKKKCENYLSNEKNSYTITLLCGTSACTEDFIRRYGFENFMNVEEYQANWDRYGQTAGYKSNEIMIKRADALIAFWDGKGRMTEHLIKLAKEHGLRAIVENY